MILMAPGELVRHELIYEVGELSPKHEGGVAASQARYRASMDGRTS